MTDLVDTFASLFRGRRDAYGIDAGGVERHDPDRGLMWNARYAAHLQGAAAIGIFPMLDDNTAWFGAIDLDEPNFVLARQMQTLIPGRSFIERSRSGNAHVWVFFERPAPAWAVRVVLRGATEAVGRRDVEVFPKQDALKPGMVGNYINLPLFDQSVGGGLSARPIAAEPQAMHESGHLQSWFADRAIQEMYAARQDPDDWERRARALGGTPPAEREAAREWGTAKNIHMCADHIIRNRETNPVTRGHRHVVLFNLAVMLLNWRELESEEAYRYVALVNDASDAPVSETELETLFGNARSGQWTRTGCDDPVMQPYVHPDCPIANGKVRR